MSLLKNLKKKIVFYFASYAKNYSDWLRAGRSGDRNSVGARFSAHVQTGPGAYPASCKMSTESFSGVKRPGREADPSSPSSAVVKKEYSYTSTPPMGPTACTEPQCLYRGSIYLYLTLKIRSSYAKN